MVNGLVSQILIGFNYIKKKDKKKPIGHNNNIAL